MVRKYLIIKFLPDSFQETDQDITETLVPENEAYFESVPESPTESKTSKVEEIVGNNQGNLD